jgi:hypothetical protein
MGLTKDHPYYHLIPEVRAMRRRRMWYALLGLTLIAFGAIAYFVQRDGKAHGKPTAAQKLSDPPARMQEAIQVKP